LFAGRGDLHASMNSKTSPMAARLLVEPPMLDRFQLGCQTKRGTLVLQVGGLGHGADDPIPQTSRVEDPQTVLARWTQHRQPSKHEVIFINIEIQNSLR
jgi:hypothetical protein